jgi:hypothetical protein
MYNYTELHVTAMHEHGSRQHPPLGLERWLNRWLVVWLVVRCSRRRLRQINCQVASAAGGRGTVAAAAHVVVALQVPDEMLAALGRKGAARHAALRRPRPQPQRPRLW